MVVQYSNNGGPAPAPAPFVARRAKGASNTFLSLVPINKEL